jgi:hypothetical protein
MLRLLLGILKGALVGGAVGFGAWKAGLGGGVTGWLVYGAIGFLVGIVCGKPLWRQETLWTPVLKGLFGVLIALGLTWIGRKFLGGFSLPLPQSLGLPEGPVVSTPVLFGPLVGIVYGIFVEVDDGERKAKEAAAQTEKKPSA